MRLNEENFVMGDSEDVKPDYVGACIGNHNADEEAHPFILRMVSEVRAFYQGVKDSVYDMVQAVSGYKKSAEDYSKAAVESASEAVAAAEAAAKSAEESARVCAVLSVYYPQIVDGVWYVYDDAKNCLVSTGVAAMGRAPVRGEDYWTESDREEIKSYVEDAILGGEW